MTSKLLNAITPPQVIAMTVILLYKHLKQVNTVAQDICKYVAVGRNRHLTNF